MSIRTWSFTRLWAITAVTWLLAIVLAGLSADGGGGRFLGLVLACIPAFLAGGWAGTHPEIREWPVIRIVAIWAFPIFAMIGQGDLLRDWKSVATIVLAPVAILTLRWFELRGRRVSRSDLPPQPRSDTPIPATTPSSGTTIG